MSRSFEVVENKIRETEFFLIKLKDSPYHSFDAQCYFSAFVSAARSVTFAMQGSLVGVKDFDQWYETVRDKLKAAPLAPFFVEVRNSVVHVGENPLNRIDVEFLYDYLLHQFRQNSKGHFLLVPDTKVKDTRLLVDATQACKEYFKSLVSVVYECYERYKMTVDPRWYFTEENFQTMGRTFEDAMVELGFPKDWVPADMVGPASWKIIRRQQPYCQVNDIFQRYLGLWISDPDDEDLAPPSEAHKSE
jgi:hypothetical protein